MLKCKATVNYASSRCTGYIITDDVVKTLCQQEDNFFDDLCTTIPLSCARWNTLPTFPSLLPTFVTIDRETHFR